MEMKAHNSWELFFASFLGLQVATCPMKWLFSDVTSLSHGSTMPLCLAASFPSLPLPVPV